ncbi:MAG: MFS transporter [Actinomycetota bacterium]|nr:MFS transporter [Actinomycetota bacterium]
MTESRVSDPVAGLSVRARGTLLVLCGALFLDGLDVSMKGVALPSISADIGMSTSSLQWVVSGYVLGFGGFLLLGGRAADLLGRKRVFLISLAVFLVASGLGGLTSDGPLLVATRFVTGVSAAFTAPAGLSIITTSFAEGPARNKALTVYTATGASGFSLGLVAGGLLTEASWRWVFLAPVLIAAITLAGAVRLLPRDEPAPRTRGFDVPGALSVTAGMLALVYALVQAPEHGWGSWRTLGLLGIAVLLLALFAVIEHRSADPLVRLTVLRSGPLIRANIGAMSLLGGWVGTLFILTLYMQQVRGWSALTTGLAVCPCGVIVALFAPRVAAPLVNRFGVAPVVATGLFASVLAYALLLPIGPDSSYLLGLLPTFLLVGVAFTLSYGPLNIAATSGVAASEQGVAGGLVNTSFQVGAALVLAVVTAVNGAFAGDGLLTGFRAALVVSVAVAVLGTAVTLLGLRRQGTPATAAVS